MKRLILFLFICLSVCACELKPVTIQVSVSKSSITLDPGQTEQIDFTVSPADAGIRPAWKSSNLSVASVSQAGLITAIGPGEATITANADTQEGDLCAIQVRVRTAIMKLSFKLDSVEIVESLSSLLELQILPDDAECTEIEWNSSNEDIATVSDGNVTAKKAGKATITARSFRWGVEVTCNIEVLPAAPRTILYQTINGEPVRADKNMDKIFFPVNYLLANRRNGDYFELIYQDEIKRAGSITIDDRELLKTVILPTGTDKISAYAFAWCSNLDSIFFPPTITAIEYHAFCGAGLSSIIIPDSVTMISPNCFEDCGKLESVTIGDNVTKISYYAFLRCSNLKTVKLGAGIKSIDDYTFRKCYNLEYLWFTSPEPSFSFGKAAFEDCPRFTVYVPKGSAEAYRRINWHRSIEIVEY